MRIFISSVISGFEEYRAAAISAVTSLGHDVIRAEDFGASPASPQRTCLSGVRAANVLILLIGERYGEPQASGLSPTHEEYREARQADKVMAFIQRGIPTDPAQSNFIQEVQQWEGGHYTAEFATPEELRDAVTRDLHRLELSRAAGPADEDEMLARALACFDRRVGYGDALEMSLAGGPRTTVIPPGDFSAASLGQLVTELSVVGPSRIFPIEGSGAAAVVGDRLTFSHRLGAVSIDELGTVLITQSPKRARAANRHGLAPLIHEDIEARLAEALRLAGHLLDKVDPTARLTTVVPAVRLTTGMTAWMTAKEAESMQNAMTINTRGDAPPVHLSPAARRRANVTSDPAGLARDLTAVLQRAVVTNRGPF